jgi:hypothetical protein
LTKVDRRAIHSRSSRLNQRQEAVEEQQQVEALEQAVLDKLV